MAREDHAIAGEAGVDGAAARRGLVAGELVPTKSGAPIGSQCTMGRTGDGVFVDAGRGGEETGKKVVALIVGGGGDDDAVGQRGEGDEVGRSARRRSGSVRTRYVSSDVLPMNGDVARPSAASRPVRWRDFFWRRRGKVEFDPFAIAAGGEDAALGVKANCVLRRYAAGGVQEVGRGKSRVAAQRHFDRGREPAERKAVGKRPHERRLREIHLGRQRLHPAPCRALRRADRRPQDCPRRVDR